MICVSKARQADWLALLLYNLVLTRAANDRTTEYVANIQYTGKNYSASAVYAYDEKRNVKSVTDGGRYTSYGYDGMSRLTRENNQALGFTKTYEYDANGNILAVKKYAYTTAVSLGTPEETAEYTYGTGARRDRLVSVVRRSGTKIIGNEEISGYDTLGNPCNYMGNVIEWEYGRRMRSCGGITYKYGADGVRTEKTVNGTVHKYYAEGETLHFETRTNAGGGMQRLWYYYDGSGICGIEYNGSVYYFQKNLQGDVTLISDGNGNLAAQYVYDAWGNHKVLNANGTEITDESFIGNVNPIRYRGYYYDEETGLYYLQSRYYDPEVGRFINADDVAYIRPDVLNGSNLNIYCGNNPIMLKQKSVSNINDSNICLESSISINRITVPEPKKLIVGAIPDLITGIKYLKAKGIHSSFAYSTATRCIFPKLGSTWRWFDKSSNYFKSVGASFKQIVALDARAGAGALLKSLGSTLAWTGGVNLVFNLIENGFDITDAEMWKNTAIDTAIGVSSYYLAAGTMSLITGALAMAGLTIPGGVVVVGVIALSIGIEALIRWLFGL